MITSLSGSFSGLVAYRDNTTTPFRGTFDSHDQEFDQFGMPGAVDALSDVRVAEGIIPLIPLTGSFVGVPPGTVVAVQSDLLNMTIDGDGYFILMDPDTGTPVYARNILMRVRAGSTLAHGKYEVQPSITLPSDVFNVIVAPDGFVSVEILSSSSPVLVGQIQLSSFATPPTPIGDGLFVEGASSPIYDVPGNPGFGTLKQGFVEEMNTARNDIADVVLRIDAVITKEDNSQLTFAVVYESGITHFVGTSEAVDILRTNDKIVDQFNKMLQNASGDANLKVEPM